MNGVEATKGVEATYIGGRIYEGSRSIKGNIGAMWG